MRVMVFGRNGQVARELQRVLPDATFFGREEADFNNASVVASRLTFEAPELVINAAAWTAVDLAEDRPEDAHVINAETPGVIAATCARNDIPMVHISSDYVFDGFGTRAFHPDDPTGPLGEYGRSKLMGERRIREAASVYAILRTSWVFSAFGANFVKTMLRLADERDEVKVVADQVGGPTPAADIATASVKIGEALLQDPRHSGTYHFSGAPDVSWADFAREIFAQAGKETRVKDIPSSEYPTPAPRPLNSRLDCGSTAIVFGLPRPDWRKGLHNTLRELKATP